MTEMSNFTKFFFLTFIVRAHQAWCSHLNWAWAERTRAGALRPFKFSVHSRRG